MSEELRHYDLIDNPRIVGKYESYKIGKTKIGQLKKAEIIPNKAYTNFNDLMPDEILVDRRDLKNIKVHCVVERKDIGELDTDKDILEALQQCNNNCQILGANVGVATDGSSYYWINPNQDTKKNRYIQKKPIRKKKKIQVKRSFTEISNADGSLFSEEFDINQKTAQPNFNKLTSKTREALENFELVENSMSTTNSKIRPIETKDPTDFAKQIWQILWIKTGATPQKILLTFVEIFMFKYLSDLGILVENKGVPISFQDVLGKEKEEAFEYYVNNVRPYLKKKLFPLHGGTTIINGGVLNPEDPSHNKKFHSILEKFEEFGDLNQSRINPDFKSKLFENFMKGHPAGVRGLGQFFTPRKVIDAMIEMSNIGKLTKNHKICDPACGVGGFILDPIKVKENGLIHYYKIKGKKIISTQNFSGFDVRNNDESRVIAILAKANMLIFLSDLLKQNIHLAPEFAKLFGKTFESSPRDLGTLERINDKDKYDLILTNPPYTTIGIDEFKDEIRDNAKLKKFYSILGGGKEGLFLEWIIRCLTPGGRAFVIIPDGLLSRGYDHKIRKFIKDQCILDAIISLPMKTFYTTPKKNIHSSNYKERTNFRY